MTDYFDQVNNGHCTVKTDIDFHGTWTIDSGSPMVLEGYENMVFGITSGRLIPGNDLFVTPLYKGINNLNEYWVEHGVNVGAWVCQTSDCGGIGGYDP